MTNIDEIKDYLKSNSISNTLDKYHKVDELYIILNIIIEEHKFHSIVEVLRKFPRTNEFDEIKQKVLNEYCNYLDSYKIMNLISIISDDELKLDLLYKYFDKFEENYEITYVINSLNDDKIKINTFKEYIQYYDSEDFSDYLRKIKNDNLRTSEFLLYKEQFPDFRLDWIAHSYSTDEKQINVFNKYYDDSKKEQIPDFISWLDEDQSKIMCLDYYRDLIPPKKMWSITFFLKEEETKIHLLKRYSQKMTSYDLKKLLLQISDEKLKLELLDEVHDLMESNDIMDIIIKIDSEQVKENIFKKYVEIFTNQDLYTMYLYVDDSKKEDFLERNINYYNSYLLYRIYSHIIHWSENDNVKKADNLLNKYIDLFNTLSLSWLIDFTLEYTEEKNIKVMTQNLVNKTNNKATIKMIYNAVALVDCEYFKNELYIDDEIFSQEEKNFCNKLSDSNPYLFNYFIFGLLDIPDLKNNLPFLEKISKFPNIAQKVVDLHKTKPNNISLLLAMLELIYQYDINYDSITNLLIEAFSDSKNQFLNNIDNKQLSKKDLLILTLKSINASKKDKDIIDVEISNKSDLINYEINLKNKLDKELETSKTIQEVKNVLLNKIFGISLSESDKVLNMYGISLDKFNDTKCIKYVKLINKIIEENEKENLINIYYNYPSLNIEEKILMDQEIKKIYNQRISDSLYKINDNTPNGHLKYGNNLIPFYIPSNEFYLLVNSLSAFKHKDKILDYNKFWNYNEGIQNHGICCSLISNQNVGQTAPIEDILVGFDSFSNKAIQLANSYDLCSTTDNLDMEAISSIRFMTPEDYVDNTRTSYNELVLERRELRSNKNTDHMNIQPSYVIIYDTFNEDKIANSLKAAHELNIPIIFLKTNEIALNENKVIEQYKNYIMDTFDMNAFNKLVVRLENNIYGFSLSNPNMIKLHFDKDDFNQFCENLFSKIYTSLQNNEINHLYATQLFNQITSILEKEIEKCKGSQVSDSLDKEYCIERAKYYINLTEEIKNHKTL